MKYLCTFSLNMSQLNQAESIRRFREYGPRTPQGVTLLGRWTRADLQGGVALIETDDIKAVTGFALQWSDIMVLDIVPVVDDMELTQVLGRG